MQLAESFVKLHFQLQIKKLDPAIVSQLNRSPLKPIWHQ